WGLDEAHYCGYLECRCQLSSSWLCSGIIEQAPNAAPAGQRRAAGCHSANNEGDMGKSILLWRLGVPIPTIVLLLLLGVGPIWKKRLIGVSFWGRQSPSVCKQMSLGILTKQKPVTTIRDAFS